MSKTISISAIAAIASLGLSAAPLRAQQPALDSLAAAVRALQAQVDSLSREPSSAASSAAAAPARTSGAYMNTSFVGLTDAGWSTAKDIGALQPGDHDPHVRGFSIPNGELALDGAVDPYFKGFANIVYKLDAKGETGVELEEMYFVTTSLPGNLQLKGGQFFLEFGRQNPQHPHSWAFADEPLVLSRMFGGEGLRSQGLRLSWLLPTSFYTEAMVSVMNSAGGTTSSFRSDESTLIHGGAPFDRPVDRVGDMLVVPRIATSVDLSETQSVVLGASAAFGPNNSGASARTSIFGADLYYKWKSLTAEKGFPFVSFQAEGMLRRYDAVSRISEATPSLTLPGEVLKDNGAYAQVLWGIKPMLIAGLRGEYANGDPAAFDSELRANRRRISPDLTWFPTEFSKIRLQYNFDDRRGIGTDHSLWMQFEFLLGAHAAHKF
ncbi:MAG: hypothetical protein JWO05_524 [Gemmatimonadetes bacterium]|nr:hypothetical protein [Gemmatimonadota bacterium]